MGVRGPTIDLPDVRVVQDDGDSVAPIAHVMPVPAADATDADLLARIGATDRAALEELYRRHAGWLTGRLQVRCGDPELADLAVQDTFVAVWRSPGSYRGAGDVAAWIWGIGVRRLIDQLRRDRRRRDRPTRSGADLDGLGLTSDDRSFAEGADAGVLGRDGAVVDALAQIDPDLRAVIVATAIDGLSTREAAHLLGVPRGTIKSRLSRARRALQEALR
ncbi:MAG: RNA polymerase sigma factor [Actinomycetota bacterium]